MNSFHKLTSETAVSKTDVKPWGTLTWFTNKTAMPANNITLGRVTIKPGCENPRHTHFNCAETLHLLAGELDHTIGDQTVHLLPGDTLIVDRGIYHNAKSIGTCDAEMIVAFDSSDRDFVAE